LSLPAAEHETSLAEFVCARLPRNPGLGDRIRIEDIERSSCAACTGSGSPIGLELHGRASPA
jgi:hypothetical protein